MAAYAAELAARLALSPRTRANYDRYTARARTSEVDYLPIKLDIENVSRCNFACTMCAVSKWPKRKRAEDMSLDSFKRLIDEQHGLVEIKLNGLGEALMQGDDYFKMIAYARAQRIWVRMTTNASLLGVRDNARKLHDTGVNEVDISIDGADAQTFEQIRVGSNFRVVCDGCRSYNSLAEKLARPTAKMWTLVQKGNVAGLHKHVELAAKLGFKHAVFSLTLHGWGDPDLEKRNAGEQVKPPAAEQLHALTERGQALGVRVAFWTVADKFDTDKPAHLCPWPFERAVVTSDLRTVPCCMIGNPDAFEIGRGSKRGFGQLWQGQEYREFRQAHLDGKVPHVCRGCYK